MEGNEPDRSEGGEVVASVDRADDDESFVIADITVEDAWLSVTATDAPTLRAWR
jgi:hypothetical protein